MPGSGIFISYRRDDTSGYAGRLYDRLVGRFGDDRVFMDIDTIAPGHEFATDIDKALTDCDACVVLIGRQWLSITDADRHRRLDDPTDFVRLEIAAAIRRGITVFPVLVDRAGAPASAALPDEIRPLAGRQAIELTNERWNYDTGRLLLALEEELGGKEPPPRQRVPPKARGPRRPKRRAAVIAGGALVLAIAAIVGWFVVGSNDPTVAHLEGTYSVRMFLETFDGTLAVDDQLWHESSPSVGVTGDTWDRQEWTFESGRWTVAGRLFVGTLTDEGTSYLATGSAHCGTDPDAGIARYLTPTTTDDQSPATTFSGTLEIHWDCQTTGSIDATFSVTGTRGD